MLTEEMSLQTKTQITISLNFDLVFFCTRRRVMHTMEERRYKNWELFSNSKLCPKFFFLSRRKPEGDGWMDGWMDEKKNND